MVIDPGEANIFSHIEYISVVFYSVNNINLPDWYIEAQSLQLYAYRLLPHCLRLTSQVAR